MNHGTFDRAFELLVQRSTGGLTAVEDDELSGMLASDPAIDIDRYELAAAAIQLAVTEIEVMPARVRARLEATAAQADVVWSNQRP